MKWLALLAWIPAIRRALDAEQKSKVPAMALAVGDNKFLLVQSDSPTNGVRIPEWGIGEIWYQNRPWGSLGSGWVIHLGIETKLVRDGEVYAIGWNGAEEDLGPMLNLRAGDILKYDRCEYYTHTGSPSSTEVTAMLAHAAA